MKMEDIKDVVREAAFTVGMFVLFGIGLLIFVNIPLGIGYLLDKLIGN